LRLLLLHAIGAISRGARRVGRRSCRVEGTQSRKCGSKARKTNATSACPAGSCRCGPSNAANRREPIHVHPSCRISTCSDFVRVSDGTRTRDRLDHKQKARGPRDRSNPASQAVLGQIGPGSASRRYGAITDGFRSFRPQSLTLGPTYSAALPRATFARRFNELVAGTAETGEPPRGWSVAYPRFPRGCHAEAEACLTRRASGT
jgi:hypothetical protein